MAYVLPICLPATPPKAARHSERSPAVAHLQAKQGFQRDRKNGAQSSAKSGHSSSQRAGGDIHARCSAEEAKERWDRAPRSASPGQFVSSHVVKVAASLAAADANGMIQGAVDLSFALSDGPAACADVASPAVENVNILGHPRASNGKVELVTSSPSGLLGAADVTPDQV
ncbi:hypothetical protein WJX84_001114 [Apatococcus fuscideae]|uniref:Uncharacterized protein n=1 Tax=Apatococcus fuscideae TaxID=2026836 RepID=A0AAW1TAI3_9CHLO